MSNWVAYHGFSININNDLDHYKKIIPCGLDNTKVTSIKAEGKNKILNLENKLKDVFLKCLENI